MIVPSCSRSIILAEYAITGLVCAPWNWICAVVCPVVIKTVHIVNIVISRCCFAEDGRDLFISACHTCSTPKLLTRPIKLFICDVVVAVPVVDALSSLKPGFHIVVSVVSVVRKKSVRQIQLCGNLPYNRSIRQKRQIQLVVRDRMTHSISYNKLYLYYISCNRYNTKWAWYDSILLMEPSHATHTTNATKMCPRIHLFCFQNGGGGRR